MTKPKRIEVPKRETADRARDWSKSLVSMVPGVGALISQVVDELIASPYERRRDAWMTAVTEEIQALKDHNKITIEDLKHNDDFLDCLYKSSQIALSTHCAVKHAALRNALFNSGSRESPDASLQIMFLNFISEFSKWHIHLLKFFRDPHRFDLDLSHIEMSGLSVVVEAGFPELKGQQGFYHEVLREIDRKGLANTGKINLTMSSRSFLDKRTTSVGDRFLNFIERKEV